MINNARFFQKTKVRALLAAFLAAGLSCACVFGFPPPRPVDCRAAGAEGAVPPFLQLANKRIANYFYKLGVELSASVDKLAELQAGSGEAKAVLDGILERHSFIANCAIVGADGRIAAIAPEKYSSSVGKDISGQLHFIKLKRSGKPVLSGVFQAVEGFAAIALQYPVKNKKNELLGSLSILIRPEVVFQEILSPLASGTPVTLLLIQTDGVLLFGRSKEETGVNIFENNTFAHIKNFAEVTRLIKSSETGASEIVTAAAPEGPAGSAAARGASAGTVETAAAKEIRRAVYWVTCGLFETRWRLIMAPFAATGAAGAGGEAALREAENCAVKAAEALAADPAFAASMEKGDQERIIAGLRSVYESCPGVYSAQWIDKNAVSRGGWPADRSFSGYDFRQGKVPGDRFFVEAFDSGAARSFAAMLVEGGTGRFYLYPVKNGGRQVGMIYFIIPVNKEK